MKDHGPHDGDLGIGTSAAAAEAGYDEAKEVFGDEENAAVSLPALLVEEPSF